LARARRPCPCSFDRVRRPTGGLKCRSAIARNDRIPLAGRRCARTAARFPVFDEQRIPHSRASAYGGRQNPGAPSSDPSRVRKRAQQGRRLRRARFAGGHDHAQSFRARRPQKEDGPPYLAAARQLHEPAARQAALAMDSSGIAEFAQRARRGRMRWSLRELGEPRNSEVLPRGGRAS